MSNLRRYHLRVRLHPTLSQNLESYRQVMDWLMKTQDWVQHVQIYGEEIIDAEPGKDPIKHNLVKDPTPNNPT